MACSSVCGRRFHGFSDSSRYGFDVFPPLFVSVVALLLGEVPLVAVVVVHVAVCVSEDIIEV